MTKETEQHILNARAEIQHASGTLKAYNPKPNTIEMQFDYVAHTVLSAIEHLTRAVESIAQQDPKQLAAELTAPLADLAGVLRAQIA